MATKTKKKLSRQIDVGYKADGTRIRKRVYGNSPTELDRQVHAVLSEFEKAPHPSEITFKEYSEKWLRTYKSMREAATQEMYRVALNKTENIDYTPLKYITATDLQEIIADNKDHPSECVKIRLTFNQIWDSAVQDGIIPTNITKRLELPSTCVTEGRALTADEKTAIRDVNLEPMQRMYVSLLYYLGLRPQEAFALLPGDFTKDTVTIQRAVGYDGNNPYIKTTKTRNVRVLPLPYALQDLLRDYHTDSYLLHNRQGQLMSKTVKSDFWLKIKKKIDAKLGYKSSIRPYIFRHTFCTTCYYSGITLKKCQYLMGHSSLQMIMKVYAHLDDEQESLDKLKSLEL